MPTKVRIRKRERGSSMLESILCIFFLFFFFACMLQTFQWISRQMILDYAGFYGAKALSLGYSAEICRKGARVAAMGASGRDLSSGSLRVPLTDQRIAPLRDQARLYMTMGQGSGVDYEFWEPTSHQVASGGAGELRHGFFISGDRVQATSTLKEPPLITPVMEKILSAVATPPESQSGVGKMYNYAELMFQ